MSKVYADAERLLARREYSAYELANKLASKGHGDEEIHAAVTECQRLGYQCDERFTENICRLRIRQGYGPLKISRELQNFQIEQDTISKALAQEEDNWLSYAIGAWEKKFKDHSEVLYETELKQKQFLLYRGFSPDTIKQVFKSDR